MIWITISLVIIVALCVWLVIEVNLLTKRPIVEPKSCPECCPEDRVSPLSLSCYDKNKAQCLALQETTSCTLDKTGFILGPFILISAALNKESLRKNTNSVFSTNVGPYSDDTLVLSSIENLNDIRMFVDVFNKNYLRLLSTPSSVLKIKTGTVSPGTIETDVRVRVLIFEDNTVDNSKAVITRVFYRQGRVVLEPLKKLGGETTFVLVSISQKNTDFYYSNRININTKPNRVYAVSINTFNQYSSGTILNPNYVLTLWTPYYQFTSQ